MDFNELKSRDVKDLRLLAAQYGIKTHHKAKAETIAKLIVEHITIKPQANEAMKHPPEKTVSAPILINAEAAVRKAIETIAAKPGFTADFPGDDTVIFKCRGAEESIHLSTIMRVIVSKAQSVSVGARNMRILKDTQTNPTANSGTIMMI